MRLIDANALIQHTYSAAIDGVETDIIDVSDVDNALTVEPEKIYLVKICFDEEQLQEIVDKAIIKCQDCKHQKKYWHEDRRMKEKGYWIYGCNLIDDSFVGTPVWGADNQFCSSAEVKKNAKK